MTHQNLFLREMIGKLGVCNMCLLCLWNAWRFHTNWMMLKLCSKQIFWRQMSLPICVENKKMLVNMLSDMEKNILQIFITKSPKKVPSYRRSLHWLCLAIQTWILCLPHFPSCYCCRQTIQYYFDHSYQLKSWYFFSQQTLYIWHGQMWSESLVHNGLVLVFFLVEQCVGYDLCCLVYQISRAINRNFLIWSRC